MKHLEHLPSSLLNESALIEALFNCHLSMAHFESLAVLVFETPEISIVINFNSDQLNAQSLVIVVDAKIDQQPLLLDSGTAEYIKFEKIGAVISNQAIML